MDEHDKQMSNTVGKIEDCIKNINDSGNWPIAIAVLCIIVGIIGFLSSILKSKASKFWAFAYLALIGFSVAYLIRGNSKKKSLSPDDEKKSGKDMLERILTFEAKDTDLYPKGQYPLGQRSVTFSKGVPKISKRLKKDFIKDVDFEGQTIYFKKPEQVTGRTEMTISKTKKNALWNLLVILLTQEEDDGWVTLQPCQRNWHGLFRRTARGDITRKVVDPMQCATVLGFHIFADKGPGETGDTRIRLERKYKRGEYKTCHNLYEKWQDQHSETLNGG